MSISKDKKRLTVSISKKAVTCMDHIISLQDEKYNSYSKIMEIATIYFYLTLTGYVKPEGENQNDENN